MSFTLPELKFSYDALEPHIDSRTMEIHHSKHHQGYTNKLNAALDSADVSFASIEDLLAKFLKISDLKPKIQQNGTFWTTLKAAIINNSTSFACSEYSV